MKKTLKLVKKQFRHENILCLINKFYVNKQFPKALNIVASIDRHRHTRCIVDMRDVLQDNVFYMATFFTAIEVLIDKWYI